MSELRVFEEVPEGGRCLLCGTGKDGKCMLIGVDGTESGSLQEALPIHMNCIGLAIPRITADRKRLYLQIPQETD